MLVRVEKRSFAWSATPVATKWCQKFAALMFETTGHSEERVFWAEESELPRIIRDNREYRRRLQQGWPLIIRVFSDEYWRWLCRTPC